MASERQYNVENRVCSGQVVGISIHLRLHTVYFAKVRLHMY